jgi:hypothetical protein
MSSAVHPLLHPTKLKGERQNQISKTTLIDLQRIDVILTTSNNESRYLILIKKYYCLM